MQLPPHPQAGSLYTRREWLRIGGLGALALRAALRRSGALDLIGA